MIFDFLFKKKTRPKKKKLSAKKARKRSPKKKTPKPKPKEELAGKITHYFPKVRAGVIKLTRPLTIGDVIHIKGHTTDFTQKITSLQINNVAVKRAVKGKLVGLAVKRRVRRKDRVYKIKEE